MTQPLAPKTPDLSLGVWGFFCGVGLGIRGCISGCGGCLGFWVKVGRSLSGKRPGVRLGREVLTLGLSLLFNLVG